jgi:hypothetical protein
LQKNLEAAAHSDALDAIAKAADSLLQKKD